MQLPHMRNLSFSIERITDASFRILEEPDDHRNRRCFLQKEDDRGICEQMNRTLEEMRQDGTSLKIIEKYLMIPAEVSGGG